MKTHRLSFLIAAAVLLLLCAAPRADAQGVVATPNPVQFGTVYIGSSLDRAVTIQNTGGGTVIVTNLALQNMWLVAYTFVSPPALPYPLGDGESLNVIIRFAPPDFSFWDGKLKIWTDSPVTPYVEVALTGFGDFPPPDPCFPLTNCDGICVDTATDINNCGGCGVVCPAPGGSVAECSAGVCVCQCDLNKDGKCNILDYQKFIQDWGRTDCGTPPGSGDPPNDCECDLNFSGGCNILDYQIFIQNWGRTDCPIVP